MNKKPQNPFSSAFGPSNALSPLNRLVDRSPSAVNAFFADETKPPRSPLSSLFPAPQPPPVQNALARAAAGSGPVPQNALANALLGSLSTQSRNTNGLLAAALKATGKPAVKRKVFFSFYYQLDINRVNVVRQSWRAHHPDSLLAPSFFDSSLWESAKREEPESIKQLIRGGVRNTSAVCVLAGSETWTRRWVKYEIARSVIDKRGLLTVTIHGIRNMNTGQGTFPGINPCSQMAVGKVEGGAYYLFENILGLWRRYQDYTRQVPKPSYLPDMDVGCVRPLSSGTSCFDYSLQEGAKNLGGWIDLAAKAVGR